jgi:hypothetical protein
MKIRAMGDELFHVDGRADMMNLTVAIRNFANATKMAYYNTLHTHIITYIGNML